MPELIISLTTYPKRINTIEFVLEPLMRQSVKADRVILWLAKDEFDEAGVNLPQSLVDLDARPNNFEIRWCERNLRPNNKYFWCMKQFPDAIVVMVDDDLIYSTDMLRKLLDAHYKNPHAVIASRSHMVTLGENGDIAPYPSWSLEQTRFLDVPRFDLLATPGAGTLFPPHCLDERVFDEQALRDFTLLADDLWLMTFTLLNNRPVVATGSPQLFYVDGTQDEGLYIDNLERGVHNEHLRQLYASYPEFHERLLAEVNARIAADGV